MSSCLDELFSQFVIIADVYQMTLFFTMLDVSPVNAQTPGRVCYVACIPDVYAKMIDRS